jgi:hypothetical protein
LGGGHAQYRACGFCFGGRHDLSDVRGAACFNARMAMSDEGAEAVMTANFLEKGLFRK